MSNGTLNEFQISFSITMSQRRKKIEVTYVGDIGNGRFQLSGVGTPNIT